MAEEREFNKVADHWAGETQKGRNSFSHRNEQLMAALARGAPANILVFSDGGSWLEESIASSAWAAFVMGSGWGDANTDAHLLAVEGIFINHRISAFQAELTAADSALTFLCELANSEGGV